jgi:hypothetical protein
MVFRQPGLSKDGRSALTFVDPLGSKGLAGTRGGLCYYPLQCAMSACAGIVSPLQTACCGLDS